MNSAIMANSVVTEKTASVHASIHFGASEASPSSSSRPSDYDGARLIIVMGVSGTGKSTLGSALARRMHLPFIDGDDLHPAANVAKMSRSEPLDDVDRLPWLEVIRSAAVVCVQEQFGGRSVHEVGSNADGSVRRPGVVVACSSLKKAYRAVLRGESTLDPDAPSLPTYFVYLKGERDVLVRRMQSRQGHFMKADMLESQLRTLESPEGEPGVVTVSVEMSTEEQVQRVVEVLGPS